jgi:hypothetical protein
MALPCPGCRQPLGMDITFIIKNPVSICPHCGVIMNFKADGKVVDDYKKALNDIEGIKNRYKGVATFANKK